MDLASFYHYGSTRFINSPLSIKYLLQQLYVGQANYSLYQQQLMEQQLFQQQLMIGQNVGVFFKSIKKPTIKENFLQL
ncbi:hypothetical protein ANCDUO_27240 [Ancylostoma duodenale]|uniref:Uncharacterized protein n=1 Tax=Ancylostoma duodenale TaxID=51022 RepID=A0A0C2FCJ6_9BILA|nr:hypothetical protein ANCDUO_27240 [Ancylostoma duodenale]